MGVENHCDGTCSSLDGVGCRMLSHEEVEKQLDEALKLDFGERYSEVMNKLRDNYPRAYKALRLLRVPHYYASYRELG